MAFLKEVARIPKVISAAVSGVFELGTSIMDHPGGAKFGMTKAQLIQTKTLRSWEQRHSASHALLASNTVLNDYYPALARQLFELAVEVLEATELNTVDFINLSGGVGSTTNDGENDVRSSVKVRQA